MPSNRERDFETLDYQETDERNQQLGAKILSGVHFESSHQPIVESSFNKAIKKGEKLPGNNSERRNYAYLSRLEKLINENGNEVEKRLWRKSINDDMLIKYENIPESYWEAKKQELRDNGYGSVKLTEPIKREFFEKERELQKESLEKWANYLGDERSPYPLWFKVYTWDGMTKMGVYSKEKGKYESRNETTVAPYPDANPEILAGVFDVINRYFGNNEKEFYTEDGERNIQLEIIAQSGNFSKIYNAIQQDIAPIVEPPENSEDVHGEWREYVLGEEDDIARAASGTGWCIATPSVGRHYLEYGTYGQSDNELNQSTQKNNSKFLFFHLVDPKTGKLSKNACASIRLNPDGKVAEISGLQKGQALNDSIVDMVETKVKTLPGGEEFLPKFRDKKELIRLDRKMQNHEDLTKEELEFIYEINHPIATLDTYSTHDPRIKELKKAYSVEYALQNGISIEKMALKLRPIEIINNLGALLNHGIKIDDLVSRMDADFKVENLDTLLSHGAKIDMGQLISGMNEHDILKHLDVLTKHDAPIDPDKILPYLCIFLAPEDSAIVKGLDYLVNNGISINEIVAELTQEKIANCLGILLARGADANQIVSKIGPYYAFWSYKILLDHGANIEINKLVSELDAGFVAENLETAMAFGADLNVNHLIPKMAPRDIPKCLETLLSHGADVNLIISHMYPWDKNEEYNRDILRRYGANI